MFVYYIEFALFFVLMRSLKKGNLFCLSDAQLYFQL